MNLKIKNNNRSASQFIFMVEARTMNDVWF
jgi:hypothetical protein